MFKYTKIVKHNFAAQSVRETARRGGLMDYIIILNIVSVQNHDQTYWTVPKKSFVNYS